MAKCMDLIGQTYGKLTVIAFDHKNERSQTFWLCECSCEGKTQKVIAGMNLRSGNTSSCGCITKERKNRLFHGSRASKARV